MCKRSICWRKEVERYSEQREILKEIVKEKKLMEIDSKFKNYFEDCFEELLERAEEARTIADKSNSDFDKGRWLGYYEVVTQLWNQAEVFGIKKNLKKSIKGRLPLPY